MVHGLRSNHKRALLLRAVNSRIFGISAYFSQSLPEFIANVSD